MQAADEARWFTARCRRMIAHKLNGDRAACNKGIVPNYGPLVRDHHEIGVTLYTTAGLDSDEFLTQCPKCAGKPVTETIALTVPFETWK